MFHSAWADPAPHTTTTAAIRSSAAVWLRVITNLPLSSGSVPRRDGHPTTALPCGSPPAAALLCGRRQSPPRDNSARARSGEKSGEQYGRHRHRLRSLPHAPSHAPERVATPAESAASAGCNTDRPRDEGEDAMVTIITESGEYAVAGADASGGALWCPSPDAAVATGWEAKPEGICRGETCVPLPAGREREFVRNGRIKLAALWRHLHQPVLQSDHGDVGILARSAGERRSALASLTAPDFGLPDLAGRVHRLSDYRGKKVLLVTWASW